MRNIEIIEVMNGWKVFLAKGDTANRGSYVNTTIGTATWHEVTSPIFPSEYVFTDWSEMMEFIEDYFAEEEE